jgi:hypothetical protein
VTYLYDPFTFRLTRVITATSSSGREPSVSQPLDGRGTIGGRLPVEDVFLGQVVWIEVPAQVVGLVGMAQANAGAPVGRRQHPAVVHLKGGVEQRAVASESAAAPRADARELDLLGLQGRLPVADLPGARQGVRNRIQPEGESDLRAPELIPGLDEPREGVLRAVRDRHDVGIGDGVERLRLGRVGLEEPLLPDVVGTPVVRKAPASEP